MTLWALIKYAVLDVPIVLNRTEYMLNIQINYLSSDPNRLTRPKWTFENQSRDTLSSIYSNVSAAQWRTARFFEAL